VAEARDGRGYDDWADGTALDGFDRSRESGNRRVPAPHASSAGRLSLCPAAVCPASKPVCTGSVPATHGISRLPDVESDKPKRQKFKRYSIGFFHIDIA
jgi:hypothetical protein